MNKPRAAIRPEMLPARGGGGEGRGGSDEGVCHCCRQQKAPRQHIPWKAPTPASILYGAVHRGRNEPHPWLLPGA